MVLGFCNRGRGEEFGTSKREESNLQEDGKEVFGKHLPGFAKTMGHTENLIKQDLLSFPQFNMFSSYSL